MDQWPLLAMEETVFNALHRLSFRSLPLGPRHFNYSIGDLTKTAFPRLSSVRYAPLSAWFELQALKYFQNAFNTLIELE